jgi:hypothetical protein
MAYLLPNADVVAESVPWLRSKLSSQSPGVCNDAATAKHSLAGIDSGGGSRCVNASHPKHQSVLAITASTEAATTEASSLPRRVPRARRRKHAFRSNVMGDRLRQKHPPAWLRGVLERRRLKRYSKEEAPLSKMGKGAWRSRAESRAGSGVQRRRLPQNRQSKSVRSWAIGTAPCG